MKKNFRMFLSAILSASMLMSVSVMPVQAATTRKMEKLSRGLIAMNTDSGIYLSWRLNFTESYDSSFDVYRDGVKIATVSDSTNYLDASGSKSSSYYVVNTTTGDTSSSITPFASGSHYVDIPLAPLDDYVAPDGSTYPYTAEEMSVGDLDGDGEYEYVIKRDANSQHAVDSVYNHRYLEAYELDGTVLWRIDMGINMNAMTEFAYLVYDFNNDGVAEVACKTAPGTIDGTGAYVNSASQTYSIRNASNTADYRDSAGKVVSGPEYFTLFDGRNGEALDTIAYPILRGTDTDNTLNAVWGDNDNDRAEKCMAVVAYLDGVNPSIVVWRGIYAGKSGVGEGRTAVAAISVNSSTSRMTVGNRFDTWSESSYYENGNEKYIDQGNHNITVGDVDNDGKDEIISGSLCIDDDISVLWCSYRGHGDAQHLGEYDPTNSVLEFFSIHEYGETTNYNGDTLDYGMTLYNGATGAELKHDTLGVDTARGVMANLGVPDTAFQFWSAASSNYTIWAKGTRNYTELTDDFNPVMNNYRIFWDGDIYDELLDAQNSVKRPNPVIMSYNADTNAMEKIFTATGTMLINNTKLTPLLQADIFGDWREELIVPHLDNRGVRIYTTNIETEEKVYTLMSDHVYRLAVAWQNQHYCQPPHIGFYMSDDSNFSRYDERDVASSSVAVTLTASSSYTPAVDIVEGELPEHTGNPDYTVDEDGDYYVPHQVIVGGTYYADQTGSDLWSFEGTNIESALYSASQYSDFLVNATGFDIKDGNFLVFSTTRDNPNGAGAKFTATNTENPITLAGELNFDMSYPITYASYGGSATPQNRGNDVVTIDVGDGALVFTITPTLSDTKTVSSAVLNVNGTDVHTFATGEDAMAWTNVNAYINNYEGTATVTFTYADSTTQTVTVPLNKTETITTLSVSTGSSWGTLLMDNLTLAPAELVTTKVDEVLPAASAAVGKGGTAASNNTRTNYAIHNLTAEDTNTLYFSRSSGSNNSNHGAAVIQFTLPAKDPDTLTGADLYAYIGNVSTRNSTTYSVYASDTNPTLTTSFAYANMFTSNSITSGYTSDLVASGTLSAGAAAETTVDEDALLAAIKERMSADEEVTLTIVFTGSTQECALYMDAEHTPTLTLEFEEAVNVYDIEFTTTPYAAVVIDGVEYCTGADGTVTVPEVVEGETISYTIVKGGYESYEGTVVAQEGASVEQLIYLSDGYFFYEDFETVPENDTDDKWDMDMPVTESDAIFKGGAFEVNQTDALSVSYKSFDGITDTICGYKLSVDFAFTDPAVGSDEAAQNFISFADENGYVICGLAYGEAVAGSGEYSLYAYADVEQNTDGNAADIALSAATLLSEDITSGTLSAYVDYVNDTVSFYIDDVYYTTIAISDEYNYTKTIDSMSVGAQGNSSVTVDNLIVTAYTPENGAIFKVWRQPGGVHVGYCWQVTEKAEDIAAYEYWLNFSENGENIFGRDYVLDFGDDFSGEGDVAFYIFLNGSNAEEKLILTKLEKAE